MQQTLFVTVQGTRRRLDVELPGDVPVNDLIPLLLEMCNHPAEPAVGGAWAGFFWRLQTATLNRQFKATQTLLENGVLDGDILLLQVHSLLDRGGARPRNIEAFQSTTASVQTGMIGITWEKG